MTERECPSEEDVRGVLVVDDDSGVRHLLKDALSCVGYRVAVCEAGEDALELMSRVSFSLLLTDYELPGMTGIELVRKLRECGDVIPAVLMSSHDLEDLNGCRKGLDPLRLLGKPFGIYQLYAVVQSSFGVVAESKCGAGRVEQAVRRSEPDERDGDPYVPGSDHAGSD